MEQNQSAVRLALGIVIIKILFVVLYLFGLSIAEQFHFEFGNAIELLINFLIIKQLFDYLRETHHLPLSNLVFNMIIIPMLYYLVLLFIELESVDEISGYIIYTLPGGIQSVGFIVFSAKLMNNTLQDASFKERISQVGLAYLISTVGGIMLPYLFSIVHLGSITKIVGIVYILPILTIARLYYYQLETEKNNNIDEFSRHKKGL